MILHKSENVEIHSKDLHVQMLFNITLYDFIEKTIFINRTAKRIYIYLYVYIFMHIIDIE